MSNLSDIGFPTRSDQDVNEMIMHVLELTKPVQTTRGVYLKFTDTSGAEIYLQGNFSQELIGFNPHYAGKSRRTVALAKMIERESSELDGGFYAWANPQTSELDSGDYPFVFDVPDFRAVEDFDSPHICDIQLTAFASNDFQIYADEKKFDESQQDELRCAAKSFAAVGLFSDNAETEVLDLNVVRPIGKIAGEIKEFELKMNALSGEKFYWFLVETTGGEIDVVADAKFVAVEPQIGGVVVGQFWLSGRIL